MKYNCLNCDWKGTTSDANFYTLKQLEELGELNTGATNEYSIDYAFCPRCFSRLSKQKQKKDVETINQRKITHFKYKLPLSKWLSSW